MDNQQAPETGYLKLPWLLVAGGLLVLLGAALGLGLMANRGLQEQVALPTPTAAPVVAAAATATRAPPTAVPATVTPVPATATPVPATSTAVPVVSTASPELSSSPTARPTVDPVLADEVSEAYLHYWDVRAEALLNLDDSRLPEVMAGDHLASAEKLIEDLRTEGHAIDTDVEHHYAVVDASSDSARVLDRYTEKSVYVDLQTHSPQTQATGETLTELYVMEKNEGVWRVVSLGRAP